jgi:tRNA A37 methylthiotransferase MiaB
MPNQVPIHIARERNKILRNLAAEKKQVFMQSFIGKALDAITLNVTHPSLGTEFTEALTDNYQKLYLKGRHAPNRWITAKIEHVQAKDGALLGTVAHRS